MKAEGVVCVCDWDKCAFVGTWLRVSFVSLPLFTRHKRAVLFTAALVSSEPMSRGIPKGTRRIHILRKFLSESHPGYSCSLFDPHWNFCILKRTDFQGDNLHCGVKFKESYSFARGQFFIVSHIILWRISPFSWDPAKCQVFITSQTSHLCSSWPCSYLPTNSQNTNQKSQIINHKRWKSLPVEPTESSPADSSPKDREEHVPNDSRGKKRNTGD